MSNTYAYLGQPFVSNADGTADWAYLGQPFAGQFVPPATLDIALVTLQPVIASAADVTVATTVALLTQQPGISSAAEASLATAVALLTQQPGITGAYLLLAAIAPDPRYRTHHEAITASITHVARPDSIRAPVRNYRILVS